MPAPRSSHQILGHVYDADENLLAEATVLLTHVSSEETQQLNTNSAGEYIFNLKNLSSWAVGDSITLKASKTKYGEKTETITISSGPADEKDITLEYASDYVIHKEISQSEYKGLPTNAVILFDFEGNKITPENPLPIPTHTFDIVNNPSFTLDIRSDGQPNSITADVKGVTYKKTYTYNDNGFQITESKWVKQ